MQTARFTVSSALRSAIGGLVVLVALVLPGLWGAAALWFDGGSGWRGPLLGVLFALIIAGLLLFARPFRYAALATLLLTGLVMIWWFSLKPSHTRDWLEDVSRLPRAQVHGSLLIIENVRNFRYRGKDEGDRKADYEAHWETRTYDMDKIVGLDIFTSDWGAPFIVHTILSWRFADGPPLAISIETRKEKTESYSAVAGFFRQYELYYVAADERDVIGVRAAHRDEMVHLYQLGGRPGSARRLLDGYVADMNAIADIPRWYNALITNCTTVTFDIIEQVLGISKLWDWRIYANRQLPRLMYEEGVINTSLPPAELKRISDITARVIAAEDAVDFSQRIRIGLPPPPPTP